MVVNNGKIITSGPSIIDSCCNRRSVLIVSSLALAEKPVSCFGMNPEDASFSYDRYAQSYDKLDGGIVASSLGIESARIQMLKLAKGRVLEIGAGTGLNFPYYRFNDVDGVTSLTLLDISEGMLKVARTRSNQDLSRVDFKQADATTELVDLFGKNSFDTVVDSFSLCVMGNEGAKKCLQQMKSVVKSKQEGGKILLLENSRANNKLLALYQDITAEQVALLGGKGCLYNQDVGLLIRESDLQIEKEVLFSAGLFRSYICSCK